MTLSVGNHLAKIEPDKTEIVPVTGEAQHRFEVTTCATMPANDGSGNWIVVAVLKIVE